MNTYLYSIIYGSSANLLGSNSICRHSVIYVYILSIYICVCVSFGILIMFNVVINVVLFHEYGSGKVSISSQPAGHKIHDYGKSFIIEAVKNDLPYFFTQTLYIS